MGFAHAEVANQNDNQNESQDVSQDVSQTEKQTAVKTQIRPESTNTSNDEISESDDEMPNSDTESSDETVKPVAAESSGTTTTSPVQPSTANMSASDSDSDEVANTPNDADALEAEESLEDTSDMSATEDLTEVNETGEESNEPDNSASQPPKAFDSNPPQMSTNKNMTAFGEATNEKKEVLDGSSMMQEGIKTIFYLLIILGIFWWLANWLKKSGRLKAIGGNEFIRCKSIYSVGAKEKIVLLEVKGKQILVGVTQHSIQPVHVFDGLYDIESDEESIAKTHDQDSEESASAFSKIINDFKSKNNKKT